MKNLSQMLKQAQQMQERMAEMQKKLESHEVEGESGGGMVHVVLNGKGEARRMKIDPKIVDANEVEILEDLVVAAINDAKSKLESYLQEEMAKVTGGMQLPPGVKLPF